jgi:hypothetical protein
MRRATRCSRWVNRAQEVARAIQSYRIPLVEIKTNNLSIAVESFSRLNKKGRSIGQDEMFSALTYEEGSKPTPFTLRPRSTNCSKTWFVQVSAKSIGRFFCEPFSRRQVSICTAPTGPASATRSNRMFAINFPKRSRKRPRGLVDARRFLREELRILNARMLPYSMQLVALSAFFGRCASPTNEQKALLKRWFWSSSFAGWFGSGNPARVRRLVDEFRDKLSKKSVANGARVHGNQSTGSAHSAALRSTQRARPRSGLLAAGERASATEWRTDSPGGGSPDAIRAWARIDDHALRHC